MTAPGTSGLGVGGRPPSAPAAPGRPPAEPAAGRSHPGLAIDLLIGVVVVAVGAALRAWILRGPLGGPDLDEATVGIQATRFGHGHVSAFFAHQAYGGTLETGLVAVVIKIFGPSVGALKVVPMACCLGAAAITWAAAAELGLGRVGRWSAAVLVWCGPAYAILFSTKERGFYGVALLLSAAYLLLVLRLDHRGTDADLLWLGLCLGLGWWQSPLTMLVAVPAVGWLVVRRTALVRRAAGPAVMAALGLAPWLAWNARNRWASLNGGYAFGTSWWQREDGWVAKLRVVTGLEAPFDPSRHLVGGHWTGAAIVVVVLVAATFRTRAAAPGLLAVVGVGYGLLYACNGLAAGVGNDPRYTYLLVPAMALAVASLVPAPQPGFHEVLTVFGVLGASVVVGAWGLAGVVDAAQASHPDHFLASPGIGQVVRYLEQERRGPALTDTAGTQITYLSHGRQLAGSFQVPRFADLEVAARAAPRSTYVLDSQASGNAARLDAYLRSRHIPVRRATFGRWAVFLVDGRVLPGTAHLRVFAFDPTAPTSRGRPGG